MEKNMKFISIIVVLILVFPLGACQQQDTKDDIRNETVSGTFTGEGKEKDAQLSLK